MRHFFQSDAVRETLDGNNWLLVAPGPAVLVIRSQQRLDDSVPGMKYSNVSGNIMGDRASPRTLTA